MGNTADRVMGGGNQYNAVFTDKTDNAAMGPSDFMKLMVAQMQNQDFTNPMDNSQMITRWPSSPTCSRCRRWRPIPEQLRHVHGGKNVTASRFTTAGELDTTGPVQKVSMVDNEYILYVGGKKYTLAQVMAVQSGSTGTDNPSLVDLPGYPLETKDVKSDTANALNWKVPTEDSMTAAGLKYTVYYAKYVDGQDDPENPGETIRQKFDTVEQVESGTLAGDKKTGVTTVDLMNLEPGTQYYANVVVTDETGTKLVKPIKFKTLT